MENLKKEYSLKKLTPPEKQNVIESYLQEVKTCKKILCHQWQRGFCSFTPKQCKYAHGLSDLIYEKVSQRPNCKQHIKEDEIFYINYDVRNYQILKDYIEELRSLGTLKENEDYTLAQLNDEGKVRTQIRNRRNEEIVLEFMRFLFAQYPNVFLSKSFICREFELIKIGIKIEWVFNSDYYFINEIDLPPRLKNTFKLVWPYDTQENLTKKLTEKFKEIISTLENNNAEITEKQITSEFYKMKVFDLPPLHILTKKLKKEMGDFFKDAHNSSDEEKKSNFVSLKDQKEKFFQLIEIGIADFWLQESKQKFGFAKLSDLIKFLQKNNFLESSTEIFQCESHFLDFLKVLHLKKQIALVFLYSETFLINLGILRTKTENEFIDNLKFKQIKSTNCGKYNDDSDSCTSLKRTPSEKNDEEKWKVFEESRIVLVNNVDSLLYSMKVLYKATKIGVDLEGYLSENGYIDLIQMGVKSGKSRKIFVFDIYFLKTFEPQLFAETKIFLKEILQNNNILKVFHDCRRDSLALHLFLDKTCPSKVYDTASMHILITHLRNYKEKINESDEKKLLEFVRQQENLLWPSLNLILGTYNASSGINKLKEEMHKRFNEAPREYFLKRPIDQEFLEYSAKDVEDLVEACENQELELEKIFMEYGVAIKEIFVKEFLMEKISYYYVREGCCLKNVVQKKFE